MNQKKTGLSLLWAIGNFTVLLGAFLKIQHFPNAGLILTIGMLLALGFIVYALTEIYQSTRINRADKIMWTMLLVLSSGIGGIVYLANSRKQIV
ncbi:MAG: PLDc N-terminal domain-containing protein [Chitinophagaceae bacterium]|nr:PLDc N-terminal domain-containing protein [Chitinophagaceae bacterium]